MILRILFKKGQLLLLYNIKQHVSCFLLKARYYVHNSACCHHIPLKAAIPN